MKKFPYIGDDEDVWREIDRLEQSGAAIISFPFWRREPFWLSVLCPHCNTPQPIKDVTYSSPPHTYTLTLKPCRTCNREGEGNPHAPTGR